MLQKLKDASEAGEKLSDVPVSEQLSCCVSDTANADDDEDKLQDEHEPHIESASGDEKHEPHIESVGGDDDSDNVGDDSHDDDNDDILGKCQLSSIDSDFPALCGHDSVGNSDCDQACYFSVHKETESSSEQATTDMMDHCSYDMSDSGHSSPCTASGDHAAVVKSAGILLFLTTCTPCLRRKDPFCLHL